MKAFVIKNEEGKYLKRGFTRFENPEKDGVFNTGHFYYENKEEAKSDIVCYGLEDCKVVPVTIAEGDLEQENKKYKKDYEILMTAYKEVIYKYLNAIDNYSEEEEKHCCEYFIEQAKVN